MTFLNESSINPFNVAYDYTTVLFETRDAKGRKGYQARTYTTTASDAIMRYIKDDEGEGIYRRLMET